MSRLFRFQFNIECQGTGQANLRQVEEMIDLTMQDLIYNEQFISALDEKTAVTIQVIPLNPEG